MDKAIERLLRGGMTVGEIIDDLSSYSRDAKCVFVCDYGDHGHTQQALPIGRIESLDEADEMLKESAYSQSHLALEGREYEREFEEDEEDERIAYENEKAEQGEIVLLHIA